MKIKYQLIIPLFLVIAIFASTGLIINLNIMSVEEANTQVVTNFNIENHAINYKEGARNLQVGTYLYVYENKVLGKQLIDNGSKLMKTSNAGLKTLLSDPANLSELSEIEKLEANAEEALNNVVIAVETNKSQPLIDQNLRTFQGRVEALNLRLSILNENSHANMENSIEQSKIYTNSARNLIYYAGFISIVISLIIALLMTEYISRPLRKLTEIANKVSQGDMNSKVDIASNDEIGNLAESFNRLINSIKIMEALNKEK
jgi:HAMP domain-containing protein